MLCEKYTLSIDATYFQRFYLKGKTIYAKLFIKSDNGE